VNYDFIGKYETLPEDADHVINIIVKSSSASDDSGSPMKTIALPFGQRHDNRTADVLSRFADIPSEHLRLFGELYSNDLGLFGYEYQVGEDGTLANYRIESNSC